MIFVTVGTHEQQFNRIVKAIDNIKKNQVTDEEIVIQTGYCTYKPKYCKWDRFLPYQEMKEKVEIANIVITHGGPASFMLPLQMGKVPIVVPRQKRYGEHVNDHQLLFAREVVKRKGIIILVEDVADLPEVILHYDMYLKKIRSKIVSNNETFNNQVKMIVNELFEAK